MRILVVSEPKTGNTWLKHLLASVYGLNIVAAPDGRDPKDLWRWIDTGGFRPGSISHQHYRPEPGVFEAIEPLKDLHLVTTLRNPYDVFVSLFFYIQRMPELFDRNKHFHPIMGKEIDSDEAIEFLKKVYGRQLSLSVNWVRSGRSIIVRYEDLLADAVAALRTVTDKIDPVADEVLERAVEDNKAERMKKKNAQMARFVRSAKSGGWKEHLKPRHLAIMKRKYGDAFDVLGYPVHE